VQYCAELGNAHIPKDQRITNMYLESVVGGAALFHLLAAHPRVVALFGIAATVTILVAPEGTGRFVGSSAHLERVEAAIRPQAAVSGARQAAAEQRTTEMLERREVVEIASAVDYALQMCGAGCNDITTSSITSDAKLLRRVLVLYELDQLAREKPKRSDRSDRSARSERSDRSGARILVEAQAVSL